MRNLKFAPDEYYHLFNRGVNKQNIFLDQRDRVRFLFCILYFQSPITLNNIGIYVTNFIKHSVFNISTRMAEKVLKQRFVELVTFTLMPNHFHLIVREKEENGISRYMQKTLNAFSKYFNAKYQKSGHLFQGPFQAVHVSNNEQLLYLSAYLHRNPRELEGWKGKEHQYPWSTYQDYLRINRWGEFIKPQIILGQFSEPAEYKKITENSGAKELLDKDLSLE